ncbi:MAG: ribosome-associated translation inhibitor RaiA [Candidatus Rokubacteria bacterium]|nr:ribosome-associated translation inhibitor RaiA [Candidatus Rokubacteria bacterium]
MQVIISGRGVVLTPSFKALVERKVARLTRVLPQILKARVMCTSEKFRRSVRLTLSARRRTFSGAATTDDLAAAVDEALEALRRQVREDKNRRRRRGGRAARAVEPVV